MADTTLTRTKPNPQTADPERGHDGLAERIRAFMEEPPPEERIFELRDLRHLATSEQALRDGLDVLRRAHRVGSPAPGIWFPLVHQPRAHAADRFMPPASIRKMAVNLLARHGVREVPSMADRETAKAAQWLDDHAGQAHPDADTPDSAPPVGVWGVPEDRLIGVDRPYALHLRWGNREYLTEYEDRFMEQPVVAATPFEVLDRDAFERMAEAFQTNPIRLEKDLKVNQVLHLLQDWQPPGFEVALTGGTALAKAYEATTRFSEDIDLHLYPEQPGPVDTEAKRQVWEHFQTYLHSDVFPRMDGAEIDKKQTNFAAPGGVARFTQHVAHRYASQFTEYRKDPQRPVQAPDVRVSRNPWTLRYDLTFVPQSERPPVSIQELEANPNVLGFEDTVIGSWLCVAPVHIAAGKMLNLEGFSRGEKISGNVPGARPVSIMRHLQDLVELRLLLSETSSARTIIEQVPASTLKTVGDALARWRLDPDMEACFNEYSKLMRPHQDTAGVPMFERTMRRLSSMLNAWATYRDEADGRDSPPPLRDQPPPRGGW